MLAFQCRTKSLSLPFFLDSSGRAFFNYFNDFFEETLIYRLMIFLFSKGNDHDHIHQILFMRWTHKKNVFFTLNEFFFGLLKIILPLNAVWICSSTNKSTVTTKYKRFIEHLVASVNGNISPLLHAYDNHHWIVRDWVRIECRCNCWNDIRAAKEIKPLDSPNKFAHKKTPKSIDFRRNCRS